LRIAVDIMGGDQSPSVLFQGIELAAEASGCKHEFLALAEKQVLSSLSSPSSLISFFETGPSIGMDASPFSARNHKDSSMAIGLAFLKERKVDAFVTTGNTGALVVNSKLHLSHIEGISKPGLLAKLPSRQGPIALIDAGALLRIDANSLLQFALMGAIYQHTLFQKKEVRVGLLNIGSERSKGTDIVQNAFKEIQKFTELDSNFPIKINFLGNIEAREVFEGKAEVIVTDGFTGNIFLKSSEGTSEFILNFIKNLMPDDALSGTQLNKAFHYQEYPGAVLSGVNGLVIKSHGHSTAHSFHLSIMEAIFLGELKLTENTQKLLLSL
jgi:phosphate acyltransferase